MSEHSTGPEAATQAQTTQAQTLAAETAGLPSRWEEGRHPVHVAHLVMGIAFAGLLVVWALLWGEAVDPEDARWLLPLPWLLAGVGGLAAAGRNARRRG